MLAKISRYGALFVVLSLTFCKPEPVSTDAEVVNSNTAQSVRYARRFSLSKHGQNTFVFLFGNRKNHDTTSVFLLAHDTTGLKSTNPGAVIIQSPCQRMAALSSIYASMLCELGTCGSIVAIDNRDYVNNAFIAQKCEQGQLKELAKAPVLDIEQTIALAPDMLFTFGMGEETRGEHSKLELSGLPFAICVDHLEETPLARAEWIKFFGAFVDKGREADSIFEKVESRYLEIKKLTEATAYKPTVFSETKFGDVWYMPGGNSYMSTILQDAGADFLWSDNTDVGSLPLSFEQVYARARTADYWINLPLVSSKNELISYEGRYAEFEAYKKNRMFNNTLHTNAKGYSTYWETGMIHPERILSDLAQIFHPELKAQIHADMYYYQPLKN